LPYFPLNGEIFVDTRAKFINGQKGIDEYIKKTTIYPEKALKKHIEGSITVQFTVKETGEIGDVQILYGGNEILETEAIRVISEMPKWKPAMKNGKPISLKHIQAITFKL
jgi:TonB family protein